MSFVRQPLGQKVPPAVSQAVRDFASGQTCTLRLPGCLPGTDTVVHAHLRFAGNAGIAQKPHDFFGVHACRHCHDQIDRRAGEALWGYDDLLRALMETQHRLYAAGLLTIGPASRRLTP